MSLKYTGYWYGKSISLTVKYTDKFHEILIWRMAKNTAHLHEKVVRLIVKWKDHLHEKIGSADGEIQGSLAWKISNMFLHETFSAAVITQPIDDCTTLKVLSSL